MELDVDSVTEVLEQRTEGKKVILALIGVAALLAATAAFCLSVASEEQGRAENRVARLTVIRGTNDAASQSWRTLFIWASEEMLRIDDDVAIRASGKGVVDRWIALAEQRAILQLTPVLDEVRHIPSAEVLPDYAKSALASSNEDLSSIWPEIQANEKRAALGGRLERIALVALFLTALGTSLLAFGGVTAHRLTRRLTLGAASGALAACAVMLVLYTAA
jgi:ABC-type Fe3+-siderophore transport system permease subunit